MKRYWLFAYHHYYPLGGFNDFQGDFDSIVEAVTHDSTMSFMNNYGTPLTDGDSHIFDSETKEIVWVRDRDKGVGHIEHLSESSKNYSIPMKVSEYAKREEY